MMHLMYRLIMKPKRLSLILLVIVMCFMYVINFEIQNKVILSFNSKQNLFPLILLIKVRYLIAVMYLHLLTLSVKVMFVLSVDYETQI